MKRAKRTIVILGLALVSCSGPINAPIATPETVSVRIFATTTAYPLLQDLAAAYTHPGILLAFHTSAASWDAITSHLLADEESFALTTYLPGDVTLWSAPVGMDGLAIIVHATNAVPNLTIDQISLIFQGRVTTWTEVGGADIPITVVSRQDGTDTRLAFDALVMGSRPTTLNARLALSNRSMIDTVARLPGAVGYISMAQIDNRVRAVPVSARSGDPAILPTPQTTSDHTYPLWTPVLVVGPQPPDDDSLYRDWFAWMQSPAGQAIVGRRYGTLNP